MFGHNKPTASMDEELGSIVPSSPKIACHITRYGPSSNSSAGGSVSSNGSSGYATRHSLDNRASAEAGAAAAAGKGASNGRSLTSSRRASVTERSSTHSQGHHTRTSSVDMCCNDAGSGAGTPTHASRGLYGKMLSYSRRSSTQESASSYQRSPRSPGAPSYSGLHATSSPKAHAAGFFSQISGKYTAKGPAGSGSGDGANSPSSPAAAKQHQQQQKSPQSVTEAAHVAADNTGSNSNSRSHTPTSQQRQQQHLVAAVAQSDDESVTGEPPTSVIPLATPGCVSPVPAHMVTALSMPAAAPSIRPAIDVTAADAAPSVEDDYAAAKAQVAAAAAASAAAAAELAAVMASGLEDGAVAAAAAAAANRQLLRSIESLKSIPASPTGAVLSPTATRQDATLPVQQQQVSAGSSSSSNLLNSQAAARAMAAIFASDSGSSELLQQQQQQQGEAKPAAVAQQVQQLHVSNSQTGAASYGGSSQTSRGISELFSDYSTDSFGSSIGGAFPSAGGTPPPSAAAAAAAAAPASTTSVPAAATNAEVLEGVVVIEDKQGSSAEAAVVGAAKESGSVLQDEVQPAAAATAAAAAAGLSREERPAAATASQQQQQQQQQLLDLATRRSLEHPAAEAALATALAVAQKILTEEQQPAAAAASNSRTVSRSASCTTSPEPAAATATGPTAGILKSPRGTVTPAAAGGEIPEASPRAVGAATDVAAEIAAAAGSPPGSSSSAVAAAAAGVKSSTSTEADCSCSVLNVTIGSAIHTGGLCNLPGSPTIPRSPLATGVYGSTFGDYRYSGDYRYPELIFRLQQFLPALKAAATSSCDFESTWEVLKSELSALVSSAKLACLQAGRLEVLDAEVLQLQRLLVLVGQHIKAGAQQQQLRDLVARFPSFAKKQILDAADQSSAGSNAAGGFQQKGSVGSLLMGKFPSSSAKITAAAAGEGGSGGGSSSSWGASAAGVPGSKRDSQGGVLPNSPRSGSPSRTAAAAAVPEPKALTAEEAAQLISLYKVRNEPQRICYKTLRLAQKGSSGGGSDGGSSSSPSGSPRHSRSASPPARRSTPNTSAGGVSSKTGEQANKMAAAAAAAGPGGSCSRAQCSSSDPACDDMYYAASLSQQEQCELQQQQQQSLLHSNSLYSTWSGVPKGFRAMKTIPEAHRKAPAGGAAAPRDNNSSSICSSPTHHMASAMSSRSPVRRARLSGLPLRASYDGQGGYPSYPNSYPSSPNARLTAAPGSPGSPVACYPQAFQQGSPERVPGQQPGRQARQQRGLANSMLSNSMGPVGWSYPHRNSRLIGSGTGEGQAGSGSGFGDGGCSGAPGALAGSVQIDYPRARARSTSPSLGMHYLEKGPGMKSRSPGAAAGGMAAVRCSYPNSIYSANSSIAGVSGVSSVCAGSIAAARQQLQQPIGTVLADDPKFRAACKTFLEEHHAGLEGLPSLKPAGGSSGEGSEGSAKLVARLSPMRDADSQQIDETMSLLSATMKVYGVSLELKRLGPFLYSASGRKLHIRMLNGNLLVRTGGGYQDMVDALGKLPLTLEAPPAATSGTTGVTPSGTSGGTVGDAGRVTQGYTDSQVSSGTEQGPQEEEEGAQEGTSGESAAVESVIYTSPTTGAKFTVSASRAAREFEYGSSEDAVAVLRIGGVEVLEACAMEGGAGSDEAWMALVAQAAGGDAV